MAELYRKSALERISSPEQLDKALKVTSPMSWLALLALSVIVIVTLIWSIVGTIPVTVTTNGIVHSPVSTNAVYMEESGKVVSVLVHQGSELHLGDPVLTYRVGNGPLETLYSDQVGTVSQVMAEADSDKVQGSEVIRISPTVTGDQVVVCYISMKDVKKLERGMEVYVYLTSADSQTYGHMRGRISYIDAYAASATGMSYVLGSDNSVSSHFTANGPVVAVTCELIPDGSTQSGYEWSNKKGAGLDVTNGSLVSVKVITEEIPPISKLFNKIQEIWGE